MLVSSMKKMAIIFIIFFCLVEPISASENILRFIDEDNSLYYDSEIFNDDIFMNHLNFISGETNDDVLLIENRTDNTFNLYFRIIDDGYSEADRELISNTIMKIFVDDEIIYDGYIDGKHYDNGINLNNSVSIGEFTPNSSKEIQVVTEVDSNYTGAEATATIQVDWEFYAEIDDAILPINPITLDRIHHNVIIFIVSTVALIVIGIMFFRIRKTRN